jgi:hypothetical protein
VVINKTAPDVETLPLPVLNTLEWYVKPRSFNQPCVHPHACTYTILCFSRSRLTVTCEECHDSVFGPGLTVIRAVHHSHFKVRNLPFIFTVCSSRCMSNLAKKPAKFWLKEP